MNDDQFLVRLRRLQPLKRVAACVLLIFGACLAVGIAIWGQIQRSRLASAFDDLAAMGQPTTREMTESMQYSRDVSMFSIGSIIGMLFAIGLACAFAGLDMMIAGRRKDRLLLEYDAAARRLNRDSPAGTGGGSAAG